MPLWEPRLVGFVETGLIWLSDKMCHLFCCCCDVVCQMLCWTGTVYIWYKTGIILWTPCLMQKVLLWLVGHGL